MIGILFFVATLLGAALLLWPVIWNDNQAIKLATAAFKLLCAFFVVQFWHAFWFDFDYHKLVRGMQKETALAIMGRPTGKYTEHCPHASTWDGEPVDSSLGDSVEIYYYSPLFSPHWCLGFNKENKLAARWIGFLD